MRIHISGMGITGSFIANALYRVGVEFTWHDIQSPYNAWQACTGCIYPSGDAAEQRDYHIWQQWAEGFPVEPASYWFNSKQAPHGAAGTIQHAGEFSQLSDNTYHLNAQQFVEHTRQRFILFKGTPRKAHTIIHTHGWRKYYLWGWSGIASVEFNDSIQHASSLRPSFVWRQHRYQMYYFYPRAFTAEYYIGTAQIRQKKPSKRNVEGILQSFYQAIPEKLLKSMEIHEIREGWRPAGERSEVFRLGDTLYIPPMRGDGVRRAPTYVEAVLKELNIDTPIEQALLA